MQAFGQSALNLLSGIAAVSLCRFVGSAERLISTGGGTLSLSDCDASGGDVCVLADGPASKLRMRRGRYQGRDKLCITQNNATVSASGVQFYCVLVPTEQPQDWGLFEVNDVTYGWLHRCSFYNGNIAVFAEGSVLTAVDVSITGMLATAAGRGALQNTPPGRARGVYESTGILCLGGRLEVRGGVIDQCVYGMKVNESHDRAARTDRVLLDGLLVRDCVMPVTVQESCELVVSRCEFRGPRRDRGSDPMPDLRNPHVPPNKGVGITMVDSSSATFTSCVFEGFLFCIIAQSTGNVAVHECEFMVGVDGVCAVQSASSLMIEDCRFLGPTPGAHVNLKGVHCAGGKCKVRRCEFRGIPGAALIAMSKGDEMSISVQDTTVTRCNVGLSIHMHATVSVQDLQVHDARR